MATIRQHNYYVYFLTNKNRTVLYVGVTNDLQRRLTEHYLGAQKPPRRVFTARYNCYYCIGYEHFIWIQQAKAREKEIKKWRKEKKMGRVRELNPEGKFLNDEILGVGWEERYRWKDEQ